MGVGGRPGSPGENCFPQGNILVIQQSDKPQPDDNLGGGVLCFSFERKVKVFSIGLMDMASKRSDFLEIEEANSNVPSRIDVEGLGDNAVQTVPIERNDVIRMCLYLLGEGGVTYISFCADDQSDSPVEAPSVAPTAATSASPTTTLGSISGNVTVDVDNNDTGDTELPGVLITLLDRFGVVVGTTLTDSSGYYVFYDLLAGDYTVVETNLAGYADVSDVDGANDNRVSVRLGESSNSTGNDFVDELASPVPSSAPSSSGVPSGSSSPSSSIGPSSFPVAVCEDTVKIDFDRFSNGSLVEAGTYVSSEWRDAFGVTISAWASCGGFTPDGKARVFDSSSPGTVDGNSDLGSPNRLCSAGGPGAGAAGGPGTPGENCIPQGNILVIQESNKTTPDDNFAGGVLCFEFTAPSGIQSVGLMDIPVGRGDFVEVEGVGAPVRVNFDGLGNNAVQRVPINFISARRLCVYLLGEGAVTDIVVCSNGSNRPSSVPSSSPSESSADSPSASAFPSAQPSSIPTGSTSPSREPSALPSVSLTPSYAPSDLMPPSDSATFSALPSSQPSSIPTGSASPSERPSVMPSISSGPSYTTDDKPSTTVGPKSGAVDGCKEVTVEFDAEGDGSFRKYGLSMFTNASVILKNQAPSVVPASDIKGDTQTILFMTPVQSIVSIDLLNVDGNKSYIEVESVDSEDPIKVDITGAGKDSVQAVQLPFTGVSRITVHFSGSGSVADFTFCIDGGYETSPGSGIQGAPPLPNESSKCSSKDFPCMSDPGKLRICRYDYAEENWRNSCIDESEWEDAKEVWTAYCGGCHDIPQIPVVFRPKSEAKMKELDGMCSSGKFGIDNIEVLHSDGNTVRFTIKHNFVSKLERAQIWFDNPDPQGGSLCFEDEDVASNTVMGRYTALCSNGWASLNIVAESGSSFKTEGAIDDVPVPQCQDEFDFIDFNPLKRCHWRIKIPCGNSKPVRHLSAVVTDGDQPQWTIQEVDEVAKVKSDCEARSKAVDVLPVAVDSCKQNGFEHPVRLISQDENTVTFSISQVWKGCSMHDDVRSLSWIAADYIGLDDHLQCSKFESLNCGLVTTLSAKCSDGASVIDLYTYDTDPSLFGQSDGSAVIVPAACGTSGDARKMCHFRYILKCDPSQCAKSRPVIRRLGSTWNSFE